MSNVLLSTRIQFLGGRGCAVLKVVHDRTGYCFKIKVETLFLLIVLMSMLCQLNPNDILII